MEQNVNDNVPPPQALCRMGCGFYGSQSFDGMCSKCYKDAVKRKQNSSPSNGRSSPSTIATPTNVNGRSSPAISGSACASLVQGEADMHTVSTALEKASLGQEKVLQDLGAVSNASLTASTVHNLPCLQSVTSDTSATTPSVNTGTTTVLSTPDRVSIETTEVTPGGVQVASSPCQSSPESDEQPDQVDKKPKKNKCHTCKKKVGLTGFQCRCGGLFCSLHRYSDKHDCQFDYRNLGQVEIRRNNPVIKGDKLQKI